MLKKLLMTMALASCVVSMASAEIQIKDLDGTNVEITFIYKDDAATEMNVIGSFDNWTVPGEPMAKNAAGLWEYKLKALVTDEIQYKFYYKGTWIFDFKAPDKKDDGFGGNNGLIVVAEVLAGTNAAAAGKAGGAVAVDPYASKLNFGMFTVIGSKTTFVTQGLVDKTQKGLETDTTGLWGESYWKVGGTLMPSVTAWFEIKAMDSYQSIWAQDATGLVDPNLDEGLANLFSGLFFNPINYVGGSNPFLNSVKTGLETKKIVWETGYGYAKPQLRTAVIWQTVEERDANDGYMRFDLGPALRKVGGWDLEATLAPNKMNGNYSFFGWVDLARGDLKLDLQYDMKSAASSDLAAIFDKLYHQDIILAAKHKIGGVEFKAQGLVNLFSEADFAPESNLAGELRAFWAKPDDSFGLTVGYRFTGDGVELLYGDNDSSASETLGTKGTQRAMCNVYGKPLDFLKIGADSNATLTTAEASDAAVELYVKPWIDLKLDTLGVKKGSLNSYAKLKYNFKSGHSYESSRSPFLFGEVGAKISVPDLVPGLVKNSDLYLGFNNWDETTTAVTKSLTTAVASLRMVKDLSAELGLGLRLPRSDATADDWKKNNTFAFSVGGSWKIPAPAIKTPVLFGAFAYNMDPYDPDVLNNLDFDDYKTDGGVYKNDGKATLRLMLKWDF